MRIPFTIPAFLLSGIVLLGGCASDYKRSPSGFLTEETYASLEEGEAREQLVTWSKEGLDLADYDAFLVDPIELRLDDDADARTISPERMTELSEYFGAAAMETEVSDSQTGKVVFAMMGGRKGGPFGFEKLDPWGHARQAMDIWAEHLAENIAPVSSG